MICGVFIGLLVTFPSHYKNRRRISKRNKEIDELEATVHEQAAQLEMIEAQLAEEREPQPVLGLEEGLKEEPAVEPEAPVEEIEVDTKISEPLEVTPVSEMEAEAEGAEAAQPDETFPLEVDDAADGEAGDEDQVSS